MAKKQTFPTQSNTLLGFFPKQADQKRPKFTPLSPRKKPRISVEGGSADQPVCLLDSSDEDEGGKGKGKQSDHVHFHSLSSDLLEQPASPKKPSIDLATSTSPGSLLHNNPAPVVLEQEAFESSSKHPPDSPPQAPQIASCQNWQPTQFHSLKSINTHSSSILRRQCFREGDDDRVPELVREEGFGMHVDEQSGMLDPGEGDDDEEEGGLGEGGEIDERFGLGDDGDEEDPDVVDMIDDDDDNGSNAGQELALKAPQPKNAFAMLMSKNKSVDVWKDVEDDRSIKRGGKVIKPGERRKAPFFKVLTGMPICVDGFRYGKIPKVTAYLLSHAHSDHYTKLSKSWKHGPIYCSQTTANLITRVLGVESKWVKPLVFDQPTELPGTGGVICTMIEANHCPGSAIFLFEGKRTVHAGDSPYQAKGIGESKIYRYLHCGDFRACPKHVMHPAIRKAKLDEIYLDTTYLNPQYCFPPQPTVVDSVSLLVKELVQGASNSDRSDLPTVAGWLHENDTEEQRLAEEQRIRKRGLRTLVAVGTYSIGKERIVKGIALALDSRIFCDARKRAIVKDQIEDPELNALITDNPSQAQVHMISLHDICQEGLAAQLKKYSTLFDRIIGFRPTGWTYVPGGGTNLSASADLNALIARDQQATFDARDLKPTRGSSDKVTMYGIPYSEHSSFTELTCFALSVPGEPKMIPTVNVGSQKSRDKMDTWIKKWATEKRKREEQGRGGIVEYRSVDFW